MQKKIVVTNAENAKPSKKKTLEHVVNVENEYKEMWYGVQTHL